MSERLKNVARVGVTFALAAFIVFSLVTAPPPAADRADRIGSLIRCPVCAGEAIADSPTQLARDMMGLVRQGVDSGLTDDQVIDSVLSSYGNEAQVLDPPFTAATLALWLMPALVAAGGVGVMVARKRQRVEPPTAEPVTGVVAEDGT
ncbi:MAG: cytochrome c-type biogenesis protein CcmH [Acidimicrobiia bacterium]